MKIEQALQELRKAKKRKFSQTLDLIVNLENYDARKQQINTFVKIPNPSPKNICGFLTKKTKLVDTVTKEEFDKFKTTREIKKFARKYDFFIAAAPLMSAIATKFGRVFGPLGKMPSPQGGIIPVDNDDSIKAMVEKMKNMIRVRTKEKTIKIAIGKDDMSDEKLKQNIESVLQSIEAILPLKRDNIKNSMIKFTMTKAIKLD